MEVLVDTGLKAADALSIVDRGGTPQGMRGYPADMVMATVIALDRYALNAMLKLRLLPTASRR